MIEIKDTRKTATKDPRPKQGYVVRIDKDYYICCQDDHHGRLMLNLFNLADGTRWSTAVMQNLNKEYLFTKEHLENYDIEVITNKITLTIE